MYAVKSRRRVVGDQQHVPLGPTDPADRADQTHPTPWIHCMGSDDHARAWRHGRDKRRQ
jgi:hypothetical protein